MEAAGAPPQQEALGGGRGAPSLQSLPQAIHEEEPGNEPLGPDEWWQKYGSKTPHNPGGGEGKGDHRGIVKELTEVAASEYPPPRYRIVSNQQAPGVNRKPDVAVIDTETGQVVKIYEAARFNKSGGLVRPDERAKIPDYEGAGILYEFHPVGPNKPPGGVLKSPPAEPPTTPTEP